MEPLRDLILNEIADDNNIINAVVGAFELTNRRVDQEFLGLLEPVRNPDFYEETVENFTNEEFYRHFRMSRNTFSVLLQLIREHRNIVDTIPLSKKLMFSIWILAKQESFLSVGNLFNISPSSGHMFFMDMMKSISNLKEIFIKWPSDEERRITSRVLKDKSGIPGVVGLIDGTHIAIKAPPHNEVDYYNRHSYHSIILQGVCDQNKKFIDIFVGMPGRMHDARVFRQSPIFELANHDRNELVHEHEHLLADKAYPLLSWILTPFRDNGHLNRQQTRFNSKMSSIRSLIEMAFGLLKGKWRRLKYLDICVMRNASLMVTAACVLHNLILQEEGEPAEVDIEENPLENVLEDDLFFPLYDLAAGDNKRNYIAAML